jgi:hypothetical protein
VDIFALENLIKEKKAQLLTIGERHGLNHRKTIQCSQELDQLLNLYMKEQNTVTHTSLPRNYSPIHGLRRKRLQKITQEALPFSP